MDSLRPCSAVPPIGRLEARKLLGSGIVHRKLELVLDQRPPMRGPLVVEAELGHKHGQLGTRPARTRPSATPAATHEAAPTRIGISFAARRGVSVAFSILKSTSAAVLGRFPAPLGDVSFAGA